MKKYIYTILICENDTEIAGGIQNILERQGYKVISCNAGCDVLPAVLKAKPDIILIDINIPGDLTGDEIIREIKNNEATKHIPVVLFSALNIGEKLAQSAGANAFIKKPFKVVELNRLVTDLLLNRSTNLYNPNF